MTRISGNLLNDTLHLVALAREAALAQGSAGQAQRLEPIEKELRALVTAEQDPERPVAPSGTLAQADFQVLLDATRRGPQAPDPAGDQADRAQVAAAMAAGGMSQVDIARHLGITRQEVRLILGVQARNEEMSR